jgi:hypothetical protein
MRRALQALLYHRPRRTHRLLWRLCLAGILLVAPLLLLQYLRLSLVSVGATTTTATTRREYGQTIVGAGRANFDGLKHGKAKFGMAFKAAKSGVISGLALPWRTTAPGYGSGSFGTFTCELQSNGANNMPSGVALSRVAGIMPAIAMAGHDDYPLTIALQATVRAGELYHLVLTNTDADPERNWSSINTVMTEILPWNDWVSRGHGARAEAITDGIWQPWSSKYNPWNASGRNTLNGAHVALVVTWADGSITGDPYWSAAMDEPTHCWGEYAAGEVIVWQQPSTAISAIGLSVARVGTPRGRLNYHLDTVDSDDMVAGALATAAEVTTVAGWVSAELPRPFTLRRGQTYRLWFASPDSTEPGHSYLIHPVYGPGEPRAWANASWGGTASHFIAGHGDTWQDYATSDLSFSLLAEE